MTDPLAENRLADAASPYLRQHADNPVNWQPWDETALTAARELDRPIFLSVGYAACHWCHVMAGESFEDPAVAAVLNDRYVPIKVDREERPDVDAVYQTICQLVTRGGGWPLSVWLTPDGRPFYVGTYFPREPAHGRPSFPELAEGLAETWATDREELEERADEWLRAIKGQVETVEGPPTSPADDAVVDAAEAALRSADREHGGFSTSGPKFPQTGRIHLLLRAYDRTGEPAFRDVAVEALDAMADGGLNDHLGGGFHRYATDPSWTVPHFEKMLYDNAELPRAYLAGYQVTGDERYAEVARETLGFVEHELTHPDGGFYSTLDAQSERQGEREEGAFYLWTPEEVDAAVGDETDAALVRERFGVSEPGNFEGRTVLTVSATVEALAESHDLARDEVTAGLERARKQLVEARAQRPRPPRDEKVLAGWNGLMISAFAEAGLVLGPEYAGPGTDALEFVREHHWDGDRLRRRFEDGRVGIDGYLEDYAFLARGALDTYQATGDVGALGFALELADDAVEEFWDEDAGALYFTPVSGETLAARPQELSDQSTPSSAGVAVETLAQLDHFVPHDRFGEVARRALETYGSRVRSNPLQHASLTLAADRSTAGSAELTAVAESVPTAWRELVGETYLPRRLLAGRPPDLDPWLEALGLEEAPPIWAERDQRDGEPTVYACRSFSCSPPQNSMAEALDWFGS
ncbi:MAG: thioredoxin domain-containing protein [Halobacteriales archaeon]|nr:thioredoxin domain-containing protein [Halobacteriales archaeon]